MIKAKSEADQSEVCRNSSCFKLAKVDDDCKDRAEGLNSTDKKSSSTTDSKDIGNELTDLNSGQRKSTRIRKPVERFQAGNQFLREKDVVSKK